MDCLFCAIVRGEIPSTRVYEDEYCLAFRDINPQAPVHCLIIPKQHIGSANEVTAENAAVIAHIFTVLPTVTERLGLTGGYRLISNVGADACQSVPHLHFHILGGEKLTERMG